MGLNYLEGVLGTVVYLMFRGTVRNTIANYSDLSDSTYFGATLQYLKQSTPEVDTLVCIPPKP